DCLQHFGCPASNLPGGPRRASRLHQQRRIAVVCEELNLPNLLARLPCPARRPHCLQGLVDQRGTDWALLNWEQLVRPESVVPDGEFWRRAYFQSGTVAVIPRRRRMNLQLARQLHLGCAPQSFTKDG